MRRRKFLETGAAAAAATALTGLARAGGQSTPKHVLVVMARGGWDTSYALDPKPGLETVDAPAGDIQVFEGIPVFTHESRPSVTAFFEAWAGQSAVVNGIQIRSIVHPDCSRRLLTGSAADDEPDIGAITAFEHGADLPVPYLVVGTEAFPGPLRGITASLGFTKQVKAVLDEPYPPASAVAGLGFDPTQGDDDAIADYLAARLERERATRGARGYNAARLDDFERSLHSRDLLFDAADSLGPRGLSLSLPEQLALAAESIHDGLCWSALATDGSMWDTHGYNEPQGQYHDMLFAALDDLLDDLASRDGSRAGSSLLDETIVVVASEMSRTPRLNATQGKDHWPITSALIVGGGVAGGRTIGGTDDEALGLGLDLDSGEVDPDGVLLSTGSLAAGLLELAGLDPAQWLPDDPLRALS